MVRKDGNSYDRTVRFLEKLPAICPVYCANGNHEQKLKELPDKYEQSYEGYKKALTACGIHMLENASETVRLDEAPVRISGLEIPLRAYARFGKKDLPLKEIIYEFFDALKSRSRGYASFPDDMKGDDPTALVKLDLRTNTDDVDALSFIVHADSAYERGRKMCEKLKEEIPRHLFEIPIQAAVGGKIIARETVKAMRKDVLAKCYGGDISRKKKLLEKQKEGKKRMRQVGNVEIPQKAFMSVLKLDDE